MNTPLPFITNRCNPKYIYPIQDRHITCSGFGIYSGKKCECDCHKPKN